MYETQQYLAIDLGAESGRGVLGKFDGDLIQLEEIHRFPNGGVRVTDSLHWDVLQLWSEIKRTLSICACDRINLMSLGVDTWGVDFALLGSDNALLGYPYHYRDSRTDGMLEEAFRRIPREEIFKRTGTQFLQINTLYQLLSMARRKSPLLDVADTFLMMPDIFNFWLTGRKACEFTDATTTQFYDPRQHTWSKEISRVTRLANRNIPRDCAAGHTIWHTSIKCC